MDTIIRKIVHIDMDAFYASVEQLDQPDLRGKAIAVGGSEVRGVIAAASYEARAYGVHSAMPSSIAKRKCPHLIFLPPRFDRYKEVSEQVKKIFYDYTDLVEPLSLDEAYLDVTYNKKEIKSAIKIAMLIRKEIKEKLGLTASAGVSFNKFLAKTASDLDKPDGLSVILPDKAIDFMKSLPISKFYGIGAKTAEKMKKQGILSGADLMKLSQTELIKRYGKMGRFYHNIITANDQREVKPNRPRKSIGAERTFLEDLKNKEQWLDGLSMVHKKVMDRLIKANRRGKTITLKIKYANFEQQTRSRSLNYFTNDSKDVWNVVKELVEQKEGINRGVRLLGISISNLDQHYLDQKGQLTLNF